MKTALLAPVGVPLLPINRGDDQAGDHDVGHQRLSQRLRGCILGPAPAMLVPEGHSLTGRCHVLKMKRSRKPSPHDRPDHLALPHRRKTRWRRNGSGL